MCGGMVTFHVCHSPQREVEVLHDRLLAMLEEMQFPQELVVNATRQNLVNELKLHGRICAEYIGGEIL